MEPPEYASDDDSTENLAGIWLRDDDVDVAQRAMSGVHLNNTEPSLNLPNFESKGIFDFAKRFLPMERDERTGEMAYMDQLAAKMDANGKAKYKAGAGDRHYKDWTVTVNDVLQFFGVWMYMLAHHQPGGREAFWRRYHTAAGSSSTRRHAMGRARCRMGAHQRR